MECTGDGNTLEDYEITTFLHSEENRLIRQKADTNIIELIKRKLETEKIHFGTIASGDIWNKNKKRITYLNQKYGALCEDMESVSVYTVANRCDIPVIAIKGISNNEILDEKYDYSVSKAMQEFTEKLIKII